MKKQIRMLTIAGWVLLEFGDYETKKLSTSNAYSLDLNQINKRYSALLSQSLHPNFFDFFF